jgi:hypothetical protein
MSEASAFAMDAVAMMHCALSSSKLDEGKVFVVDADLQSYFDTIPKDRLMRLVRSEDFGSSIAGFDPIVSGSIDPGRTSRVDARIRCSARGSSFTAVVESVPQ